MSDFPKPWPIVLNQSSLKEYNNCQRLYGWRRLQRLDVPTRRSATEIGTAVHAGLALFHSEGSLEKAVVKVRESLEKSAGIQSTFEDKSLSEAQDIADRMLPAYVEYWQGQNDLWAPLNQEVQFLVEVGDGTNVWLRGRADNLSIIRGGLYLVDYKTAGRMDPRDLLKYELDFQLTAYIYGLSKQLTADSLATGGPPVRIQGAVIDLLVKTKVPQFARELYTRSEQELAEFELEFVEYATRIRAQMERIAAGEDWKTVFPKNTEHCFRYGTCPFRDLCLKDTDVRRKAYVEKPDDYVDEAQVELMKKWEAERGV
jgi:PD-(D/E)XK nuclease superfamily protein